MPPCVSHLLQPICQMHIRARGIIGLVNSVLYRLNNNFAGVNANTDLQIGIAEACNGILHRQRCEAAPNCVVLMRLWGSKESHHPVAL